MSICKYLKVSPQKPPSLSEEEFLDQRGINLAAWDQSRAGKAVAGLCSDCKPSLNPPVFLGGLHSSHPLARGSWVQTRLVQFPRVYIFCSCLVSGRWPGVSPFLPLAFSPSLWLAHVSPSVVFCLQTSALLGLEGKYLPLLTLRDQLLSGPASILRTERRGDELFSCFIVRVSIFCFSFSTLFWDDFPEKRWAEMPFCHHLEARSLMIL